MASVPVFVRPAWHARRRDAVNARCSRQRVVQEQWFRTPPVSSAAVRDRWQLFKCRLCTVLPRISNPQVRVAQPQVAIVSVVTSQSERTTRTSQRVQQRLRDGGRGGKGEIAEKGTQSGAREGESQAVQRGSLRHGAKEKNRKRKQSIEAQRAERSDSSRPRRSYPRQLGGLMKEKRRVPPQTPETHVSRRSLAVVGCWGLRRGRAPLQDGVAAARRQRRQRRLKHTHRRRRQRGRRRGTAGLRWVAAGGRVFAENGTDHGVAARRPPLRRRRVGWVPLEGVRHCTRTALSGTLAPPRYPLDQVTPRTFERGGAIVVAGRSRGGRCSRRGGGAEEDVTHRVTGSVAGARKRCSGPRRRCRCGGVDGGTIGLPGERSAPVPAAAHGA
mmetsp:Transcript_33694/g.104009  ORF Transcript_33694/g.104009 Transcript_33694/m.104009 type:complete len:386 (-) Transcript_33694:213-1370(-)